jgi:ketosteroid isomerase-like protein
VGFENDEAQPQQESEDWLMHHDFRGVRDASGLTPDARAQMGALLDEFERHNSKNRLKRRYFEQRVTVGECNLGIALPRSLARFEMACCWPEKAVTVLKDRSVFDGYVAADGTTPDLLAAIVRDNRLVSQYNKAVGDELMHGVVFATLSAGGASGVTVRFHSGETAAGIWDGGAQRLSCGFAITETTRARDGYDVPSVVNLYTDDAVWVIRRDGADRWHAEGFAQAMGRPLMVAMANEGGTTKRPLGRSRISRSVRDLTRGYIRTMSLATVALEFSTSPQKYLLGITDEQYDALISDKFKTYMGSMLLATRDENGDVPQFGQLSQGSIAPHVEMLRSLATQFAASTSLSVTDTGVVNDANPTSADAVAAANEKLIVRAQELNRENGDALYTIALMAQAIARNKSLADLADEERAVMAKFQNPAMPSVASTADAAVKIASVDPSFGGTEVFYEMLGFDAPTIARIMAQRRRNVGNALLDGLVSA